jgi:hypothetical protein
MPIGPPATSLAKEPIHGRRLTEGLSQLLSFGGRLRCHLRKKSLGIAFVHSRKSSSSRFRYAIPSLHQGHQAEQACQQTALSVGCKGMQGALDRHSLMRLPTGQSSMRVGTRTLHQSIARIEYPFRLRISEWDLLIEASLRLCLVAYVFNLRPATRLVETWELPIFRKPGKETLLQIEVKSREAFFERGIAGCKQFRTRSPGSHRDCGLGPTALRSRPDVSRPRTRHRRSIGPRALLSSSTRP